MDLRSRRMAILAKSPLAVAIPRPPALRAQRLGLAARGRTGPSMARGNNGRLAATLIAVAYVRGNLEVSDL